MKKNGFTLAELMGVLVILSIIATVVFVAIDRSIKNSRYNTCLTQEKNIIEGAKTWSIDYPQLLPTTTKKTVELPFSILTDGGTFEGLDIPGGYLESGLVNPMTNEAYSSSTVINITTVYGSDYDYEVVYASGEECVK